MARPQGSHRSLSLRSIQDFAKITKWRKNLGSGACWSSWYRWGLKMRAETVLVWVFNMPIPPHRKPELDRLILCQLDRRVFIPQFWLWLFHWGQVLILRLCYPYHEPQALRVSTWAVQHSGEDPWVLLRGSFLPSAESFDSQAKVKVLPYWRPLRFWLLGMFAHDPPLPICLLQHYRQNQQNQCKQLLDF